MDVYVTGFPRSGTHWMARLLSDLLDSPIQSSNRKRALNYNHCRGGEGGHLIHRTHLRQRKFSFEHPIVHIMRDPRDVAVSFMYYQQRPPIEDSLMAVVKWMTDPADIGPYTDWVGEWLLEDRAINTRYYRHHSAPNMELLAIGKLLEVDVNEWDTQDSVDRQRFHRWKRKSPRILRKGIVGDWRSHFTLRVGECLDKHVGDFMRYHYYHDKTWDEGWYEELPEEITWIAPTTV